jgi:hypothetical protein
MSDGLKTTPSIPSSSAIMAAIELALDNIEGDDRYTHLLIEVCVGAEYMEYISEQLACFRGWGNGDVCFTPRLIHGRDAWYVKCTFSFNDKEHTSKRIQIFNEGA